LSSKIDLDFDISGFRDKVNALCDNGVDFVDAILSIAEDKKIEIDILASILKKDPEFKARLYMAGEKLNYFRK